MATLVLAAAGAAVGGAIGGSALGISTAVIGRAVGATLGRVIDQRLMGGGSEVIESGKLERFRLTGASEGTSVGNVYGRMRLGGQVVWSSNFLETSKTRSVGGKGGGGGTSTKTFSYSVSLAIALCEGEILRVGRIWADGMEISRDDLDLRVYTGSEDQMPDPKIEAIEGPGNAPSYRGIAYVVFEDLRLDVFGNRVPQFSFEIIRATSPANVPESSRNLSDVIKAVAMIPGTGEYALATTPVQYSNGIGWKTSANINSPSGKPDFSASLEHLTEELPKCSSVSLVVSWFGDDLRCDKCRLAPKVEQKLLDGDRMPWNVSGVPRDGAEVVPTLDDRAIYGGTPSDQSVHEAIQALKEAGKDVMFYPFVLMEQMEGNDLPNPWTGKLEQPSLPWRGRITTSLAPHIDGSPDETGEAEIQVRAFFGQCEVDDFLPTGKLVGYQGPATWGYRRFILHYAHLCALSGGVDAFCIGSEMRELTRIRGENNSFPAVDELRRLAADVRRILGPDTKIGYGADWSEYFGYHPQDGSGDVFFHLDPLWTDPEIDFVGIDNYMPVSDWRDGPDHADAQWKSIYDVDHLKSNVAGGEGYDWYYADQEGRDTQDRRPIEDGAFNEPWIYRYKDVLNWWRNPHHDRIGGVRKSVATDWVPEGKPIWFTELGCAAIDKGTNQPNKFLDPKSSESDLAHYSTGARDDLIQAQYLRALNEFWNNSANNPISMVYGEPMLDMSRAHVWAWDARPFPRFPENSDLWSDGENYTTGHWLNGRTSSETLAAVVSDICARSGVENIDVSGLHGLVRGYAVDDASSARAAIQPLMLAHAFDASEREGMLHFRSRTGWAEAEVSTDILAISGDGSGNAEKTRAPSAEMSGRVRLIHVQSNGDFETRTTEAVFPDDTNTVASTSELAMSLTNAEAQRIAERWLTESRVARDTVRLALPPSRRDIVTGDVFQLNESEGASLFRVDRVETGEAQFLEATRVEPSTYRAAADISDDVRPKTFLAPMPVYHVLMDLPLLTGNENAVAPYVAVTARPWPGSVAVYSSSEDDDYQLNRVVDARATIGKTESPLRKAAPGLVDRGVPVRVRFGAGVVSSVSHSLMLNGENAAAIGDPESGSWEVFQFGTATLVDVDTYELSNRLRGQAGTDGIMPDVWPEGSVVAMLDGAPEQIDFPSSARGLQRHFRIGPTERPLNDPSYVHSTETFQGVGLRPYAPVHLHARRNESGQVVFSWVRRTRMDGDSWSSFEVPLGEEHEQYLVQIVVDAVLLREEIVSIPTWSYEPSQQDQDGHDGAFLFRVAQISDRFGAGPYGSLEIDE